MALLTLGGCAPAGTASGPFKDPDYSYRVLSGGDRMTIAAIAAVMLTGSLPSDAAAHDVAMVQVVRGVDVAVAGLPPSVQEEIGRLFGLLRFSITRVMAAGVWRSWENASAGDVAGFLARWRTSGIALFRSGYQALHQLIMASWYGNGAAWSRIGYPGPPGPLS